MTFRTIFYLFLFSLFVYIRAEAVDRHLSPNEHNDALSSPWRFPNPFELSGRRLMARQDCVSGCQKGEKCCTSPEGAQFCVSGDAICCGRTWCDDELEVCCRDGPHGGCCPKDMQCAIGGKGCCLKDRPCFGPFTCYDNDSIDCKDGIVESFQCCPKSAPYCLFDPVNGYGCFVSKVLPTYSTSRYVPSTVNLASGTSTRDGNDAPKPSGDVPSGSITTSASGYSRDPAPTSVSESKTTLGSSSKPTLSSSTASISNTAPMTTKRNKTEGPSTTDATGAAAGPTAGSSYGLFKQVGAAGLALLVVV